MVDTATSLSIRGFKEDMFLLDKNISDLHYYNKTCKQSHKNKDQSRISITTFKFGKILLKKSTLCTTETGR